MRTWWIKSSSTFTVSVIDRAGRFHPKSDEISVNFCLVKNDQNLKIILSYVKKNPGFVPL